MNFLIKKKNRFSTRNNVHSALTLDFDSMNLRFYWSRQSSDIRLSIYFDPLKRCHPVCVCVWYTNSNDIRQSFSNYTEDTKNKTKIICRSSVVDAFSIFTWLALVRSMQFLLSNYLQSCIIFSTAYMSSALSQAKSHTIWLDCKISYLVPSYTSYMVHSQHLFYLLYTTQFWIKLFHMGHLFIRTCC